MAKVGGNGRLKTPKGLTKNLLTALKFYDSVRAERNRGTSLYLHRM